MPEGDTEVIKYDCLSSTQKIWLGMMVVGLIGLFLMIPAGIILKDHVIALIIVGVVLSFTYAFGSFAMALNSGYREIRRRFA